MNSDLMTTKTKDSNPAVALKGKGETMDCPLLSNSRLKPCKSTSDVFANTIFSSDKYCKGIWFTLCPLYRQQKIKENIKEDFMKNVLAVRQDNNF
jgi:hypothetical protein